MRFPEFKDEWEETFLNDCSDYISERINTNKLSEEQYISTENMLQNFYGVENSNNVPNNSNVISFLEQDILISNIRPYLKKIWLANRNGGASTDVLVLRAKKNIEPSFLFYNLANDNFINHVMAGCKGVKMPRGDKHQILTYKLGIPSSSEQSKISDFLSLLDKRIELQKSAIEKLKSLMAGIRKYAQSLNSCKRTFLRDILTERKEKNSSLYPVYSVAVKEGLIDQIEHLGRSFAAKDTSNYHVVNEDDIVYTKSPTGEFPYGIVKKSFTNHSVAVSPLYGVYIAKNKDIATFLHYYFLSPTNTNNYLHCLIQKGAKNTINITNQHFLDNTIELPDTEDLHKIVNGILAIQNKIEVESNTLKSYLDQKSYLLSKMFI